MKFLRHLLGITKLDKEKNHCIRRKTGAENIVKEIKQYQEKWLQHVQRMDTNRIPKQALQYKQRSEAAQIKFLRHLLGITKLDKEKNQCIREKKQEHRKWQRK